MNFPSKFRLSRHRPPRLNRVNHWKKSKINKQSSEIETIKLEEDDTKMDSNDHSLLSYIRESTSLSDSPAELVSPFQSGDTNCGLSSFPITLTTLTRDQLDPSHMNVEEVKTIMMSKFDIMRLRVEEGKSMANDGLVHRATLRLQADSHTDDIEALNLQMKQMSNTVRDEVELIQSIKSTVHCQQVFNKVTDQLEQQIRNNLFLLYSPIESSLTWSSAHPEFAKKQEALQNDIAKMDKEISRLNADKQKLVQKAVESREKLDQEIADLPKTQESFKKKQGEMEGILSHSDTTSCELVEASRRLELIRKVQAGFYEVHNIPPELAQDPSFMKYKEMTQNRLELAGNKSMDAVKQEIDMVKLSLEEERKIAKRNKENLESIDSSRQIHPLPLSTTISNTNPMSKQMIAPASTPTAIKSNGVNSKSVPSSFIWSNERVPVNHQSTSSNGLQPSFIHHYPPSNSNYSQTHQQAQSVLQHHMAVSLNNNLVVSPPLQSQMGGTILAPPSVNFNAHQNLQPQLQIKQFNNFHNMPSNTIPYQHQLLPQHQNSFASMGNSMSSRQNDIVGPIQPSFLMRSMPQGRAQLGSQFHSGVQMQPPTPQGNVY